MEKIKIYLSKLSNLEGVNIISNLDINKINDYAPIACWIILDSKKYKRNKVILGCINIGIPTGSFNYNTIIKNDFFEKFVVNKNDNFINSQNLRDNSIFCHYMKI